MPSSRVQVIDRSFDILETLSGAPRPLSDICRETGLSKGTVFRLLAGLAERGMVLKDPNAATYMLGPGLLRLVQGALSGISAIAVLGHSTLEELARESGETAALHVQSGIERVCIDEAPSPQPIRYTSGVGSMASLDVGAAGKVLIAFSPEEEAERSVALLERAYDVDPTRLRRALAQVRRDGYGISRGERVEGASAISIPVRAGMLSFSLSLLGPSTRLPKESLVALLGPMHEAAATLEALFAETQPGVGDDGGG